MMDESSLENALAGYQSQLDHISQMIKEADTMEKLELYDLEKDMKELIQVTQEQLLSLKKENLIKTLHEGEIDKRSVTSPSNQLQSQSHVTSSSIKTEGESTKNELVNSDDVNTLFHNYVGTKCRVRYTQSWGSFQSHNAIILSIEEVTQTDDIDLDVKVRVLFLNPTHKEMVPCRYFMDGKCNYAEENCRFSHGHIVTVDDLEEYVEPDFKDVEVGSKVLAKHIDGVWHPAVIQDVHEEKFIISFDTKRKASLVTVDLHEVFPIGASSDTSGNESEFSLQSDSDDDDMSISSDDEAPATLADACKTQRVASDFGVWEEHTRGIGSKLMAKMGYIIGKGLGKNSEGRIEPVEINLLPAGKSLDKIAELREKGRIKDPTKRNRKKVLQKIEIGLEKQKKERAAFDLIDQLTKKQTGSNNLKDHHSKGKFSVEDSYKQMKKSLHQQKQGDVREKQKPSSCSLNVQVLKNNEKIKNLKKRLVKLKESLARNPGDTSISRTIQNNLNQTQHELDQLIAVDNSLQTKINMKQQSRKLTVF